MVFSRWGNDGGVRSTSPSPDNTVKAENVAVSFSGWTALSMGVSVSSLGHRGTSSGFGLPASVWESWGGPGLGFWVRSRYRDDSELSGWPTGTSVGRGRPGNTGVGGSAMLMASLALWETLGGDVVTTSRGNESGSGGGMIRGITGSRYPLRTPVTGAVSVVTMATAGDVTEPAALPLITADSDTDGGGVVTPGGGVVTPRGGVVTTGGGVVVGEVVGSGPAVVTGAEFGLLVVATVTGVAGVVLVVVMVTGGVVTLTGLVV